MARLRLPVHVKDPGGQMVTLHPGEDVPSWAEQAITNPKAWGEETFSAAGEPSPVDGGAGQGDDEAADAGPPSPAPTPSKRKPPTRRAKG